MNKKRSKLLIVLDILETLMQEEINPTRLATLVNMPYDRLSNLLKELNDRGLVKITAVGKNKSVSITPKGVEVYNELKKIIALLEDYGLI
ncbi:MAG: winged helix-turn-helix domain-containing protein [Ignisphaera sp.]